MPTPPKATKAPRERSMSPEHKAALAQGREEGRPVRLYLEALAAAKPRRGKRNPPWHEAHVTNGPTEAVNNLTKRIGFGFRNFENYQIRALLYAGKPN